MPTDKRLRGVDGDCVIPFARDLGDPLIGDRPRSAEPGGAAAGILGPDEPSEVALGFTTVSLPEGLTAVTGTNPGEIEVSVTDVGALGAVEFFVFDADGVQLAYARPNTPYTFEDLPWAETVTVYVRGASTNETTEFAEPVLVVVQD